MRFELDRLQSLGRFALPVVSFGSLTGAVAAFALHHNGATK